MEGNSLVIVPHQGLEGEASVFGVMHNEGQPLTLGIVVSVILKEGREVIL